MAQPYSNIGIDNICTGHICPIFAYNKTLKINYENHNKIPSNKD